MSVPTGLAVRALAPGIGMVIVAFAAAWYWKRASGERARWFWIGAAIWTVGVLIKVVIALFANAPIASELKSRFTHAAFLGLGGLFIGVESSLCEIGVTLVAGLYWRQLGQNARRAIAVGVGAGAFEALLLGLASIAAIVAWLSGAPGTEPVAEQLKLAATTTPVSWLVAPVERVIAILVHAASRGLVLVGISQAKPWMIASGFAIFTFIDGLAGAFLMSGSIGTFSLWWIELALSVTALTSVPALAWLCRHFDAPNHVAVPGEVEAG
jgi:uncharacterized membrane protein YhfC